MSSILQELIKYTDDKNIVNEYKKHQWYKDGDGHKRTALMWVIHHSNTINKENIVKMLIDAKVDINLQDYYGWTALMWAARYSNTGSSENIVKMLIDANAYINVQENYGWTALMMAARNSNTDSTENTVKMLIDAGANINLQNRSGWTALMAAARNSNTDSTENTVKMLIDAGANINLQDIDKLTALKHAVIYSKNKSTEKTVNMLIDSVICLQLYDNFNFGTPKDKYLSMLYHLAEEKDDHKYVKRYYTMYFSRNNLIYQLKQININHIHYKPGAIRQRINMLNILLNNQISLVELDKYKDIILYLGVCNVAHLREKIKFYVGDF
jgi:ankyrin repeat protein